MRLQLPLCVVSVDGGGACINDGVWTDNKLGVEGVKALVPALMQMPNLTSLDVEGPHDLG